MSDYEKLYRLSRAVGTSLDLERNCERFLGELMDEEALSYAAVWLNHRVLVGDGGLVGEAVEASAVRAFERPRGSRGTARVPLDHGAFKALEPQDALGESLPSPRLKGLLDPAMEASGKAAVFSLGGLGLLLLVDQVRRRPFARNELRSLKEVVDVFARSLNGCLAYQAQSREVLRRKHLESEVRHRQEHFRALIENALDLILVLDYDSSIKFASPSSRRVLGYDPERLTGRNLLELVHPDELESLMSAVRGPLLGPGVGPSFEFRFRNAGGAWRVLDVRTNNLLATPAVGGIILNCRDVTESREFREALRSSEERFALAVRGSNDGIWDWDLAEDHIYLSPRWCEMLGLRGAPSRPSEWFDRVHPDDLEGLRQAVDAHLDGSSEQIEHEYRIRHAAGRWVWVLCRGVAVRDADGRASRVAGSQTDITESKRQQAELEEARAAALASSRARGEFLANMSHEIRTPMNGVIGVASLLLESRLSADQRDLVQTIQTSGEALLTIVNDVLDFSKIESGRIEIEWAPFDIVQCVEDAVDVVAPQAGDKRLELLHWVDETVPPVLIGDAAKIRQILINLLGNAVKFTSDGYVMVRVKAERIGSVRVELRVEVEDTGIGIPAEGFDRLFEPFTQADASTTRRFGGSGLGLTICRRLVDALGGGIEVESREGYGSTFSFVLTVGVQSDAVVSDRHAVPPALPGRVAVLCEPSEPSRRMVESWLRHCGMEVEAVATPDEAAAACSTKPVDVMVAAIAAAGEAAALVAVAEERGIPLVLLKGMVVSRAEITDLASSAGLWVVGKPVKQRRLTSAVATAVLGPSEEQAAGALGEDRPEMTRGASAPLRVLVADDNPINRSITVRMLERLGHTVGTVSDGREVLDALRETPYDVVLMDLQMPGIDGYEATRQIRSAELTRDPRVIAVTAHVRSEDRQRCLDSGMNGFLSKPFQLGALQSVLDEVGGPDGRETTDAHPIVDADQLRRVEALGRPGFLDQLISVFVATGRDELQTVRDFLSEAELPRAEEVLHRFLGSCVNLGAHRLAAACRGLEVHLEEGHIDSAAGQLGTVEALFDEVVSKLEQERSDRGGSGEACVGRDDREC